jgi:hypothetical protein
VDTVSSPLRGVAVVLANLSRVLPRTTVPRRDVDVDSNAPEPHSSRTATPNRCALADNVSHRRVAYAVVPLVGRPDAIGATQTLIIAVNEGRPARDATRASGRASLSPARRRSGTRLNAIVENDPFSHYLYIHIVF